MNIIYITDYYVHPLMGGGGIARTTYVMAQALREKYGYRCYSFYARPVEKQPQEQDVFEEFYLWKGTEFFIDFINRIGGGIIIIQLPCLLSKTIFDLATSLESIKIITVYHGAPGFELAPLDREVALYHLLHNIERRWTIKQILLKWGMRILPYRCLSKLLQKKYAFPYDNAYRMVVLSPGVIPEYQLYSRGDKDRFIAIPNARSFPPVPFSEKKYTNKEVLIVARIEDWQKRILEALKIWKIVKQNVGFSEWKLRIVGDGVDKQFYQKYVKQDHIKDVIFEGLQKTMPYYQKASIFLMTSAFEGLPMTILEAQQCGCVPIVYDSFASAKDVINSGENGILIANQDREAYVAALKELMTNEGLRKRMSEACVQSSERFSVENVAAQWEDLLKQLE